MSTVAPLPPPPGWADTVAPVERGREFSVGYGDSPSNRFLVELVQTEYLDEDSIRRAEPRLYVSGQECSPEQAAQVITYLGTALSALTGC